MAKLKLNTDRIIGLTAMLVGLLTLIIFINQTNIMREQSRLSVKPRLSFRLNMDSDPEHTRFSLKLYNKGLGPAMIDSVSIYGVDAKRYLTYEKFLSASYPLLLELGELQQTATLSKGDVLTANEEFSFFTFQIGNEKVPQVLEYLKMSMDDEFPWTTSIEYSSMYNERWWISDKLRDHPRVLED